jgi:hypothetical protein
MRRSLLAVLVLTTFLLPIHAGEPGWKSLFNGKDLAGWDTWLGKPQGSKEVVGLNKDPKNVYTVVDADGKPAIRISGEIWGAITTHDEFENYHLKLEFKWGEKRWPPREKTVRDSGLLYHCIGPHGAQGSYWMKSHELQIQEKDVGDYYSVAGPIVDVEGTRPGEGTDKPGNTVTYKKGGKVYTVPSKEQKTGGRIIKSPDAEKKTGEWNVVDLVCVGTTSVHICNGKVNMILTNSRVMQGGKEVPLTKGKIQLQSESAEVFYRNIQVRPVSKIPNEFLKQ